MPIREYASPHDVYPLALTHPCVSLAWFLSAHRIWWLWCPAPDSCLVSSVLSHYHYKGHSVNAASDNSHGHPGLGLGQGLAVSRH